MIRHSPERREQTRARLLTAAAREFRARGYVGIGVDGLAHAAGMTSGAFYKHFRSKADVFGAVVRAGATRLRDRVLRAQATHGSRWLTAFAEWYLSPAHCADVAGGCGLPSLSTEIARADDATRAAWAELLDEAARAMAAGAGLREAADARERALGILAVLAGGVMLARAAPDGPLADEVLTAAAQAVARLGRVNAQDPGAGPTAAPAVAATAQDTPPAAAGGRNDGARGAVHHGATTDTAADPRIDLRRAAPRRLDQRG